MGRGSYHVPGILADGFAQNLGLIPILASVPAVLSVFPERCPAPIRLAHTFQAFAEPQRLPDAVPKIVADLQVYPAWLPPRPARADKFQAFAHPESPPSASPARGLTMAAVLTPAFDVEAGSSVTYSWATDVLRPRNGRERRISLTSCPREAYQFTANLSDDDVQKIQSAIVVDNAAAKAFGVALIHESLPIVADSVGFSVQVPSTTLIDWAYVGQTVLVVAPDEKTTKVGVVQSKTSTTITLDVAPGSAGKSGGRIMPVIPCYLEDTQTFGLYPINAGVFTLKAHATYFGNATSSWSPTGASVRTYTDPLNSVTHQVFDVGIAMQQTSPRAALAVTELTDRGGVLNLTSIQSVGDFQRQIIYKIRSDADRQYLKAFHGAVHGRQKAFYLPTWRGEFVFASGDASTGTIHVLGPPTIGFDYANKWFNSIAHKHVMFVMSDGTTPIRTFADAVDNFDGTQTMDLDSAAVGSPVSSHLVETCRLDTDDIVVTYDAGGVGTCILPVRVVQQY